MVALAGLPVALLALAGVAYLLEKTDLSRNCLHWCRALLLAEFALLIAIAIFGAIYEKSSREREQQLHPAPGKLVDIGGYRLHLYCSGTGGPTVVLEHGLVGSFLDWYLVQPQVASFTRVCSYDRGGYGWSDPSPKARVPSIMTEELHKLLHAAGEKPPFVIVGHSMGAFDALMFAKKYHEEVAGVVLVDGSHPDEDLPFPFREKLRLRFMQWTAPFGLPRWRKWCGGGLEATRPMKKAFACNAQVFRSHYEQWSAFPQAAQEIRALGSLGEIPLAVVSRDPNRVGSDDSRIQRERRWQELQRDLLRLSRHSSHIVAEGSTHAVPGDRPDVVSEAIRQLVEEFRATHRR